MGEAADFCTDQALSGMEAHRWELCGPGCPECEGESMWEDLERFDADFCPAGPVRVRRESVIPNGIYTLEFPASPHRTFRIHTKGGKGKLAGRRIISLLIGPDNETEYKAFGFVEDSGITVWKRFRGPGNPFESYADAVWLLATGGTLSGHKLSISKRCLRCNRTLTTPESLESGLGPECRKRSET